jgi:hypothetical protein
MTDGAPETLTSDQNGSAPFGPSNGSAAPIASEASPAMPKIYIYLKAQSGQILCGYFEPSKLRKLVKHFVECEVLQKPPNI